VGGLGEGKGGREKWGCGVWRGGEEATGWEEGRRSEEAVSGAERCVCFVGNRGTGEAGKGRVRGVHAEDEPT
jgi:hypothetical protein